MKRLISTLAILLAATAFAPAAADAAEFGLNHFDITITDEEGHRFTEAGAHPFAVTTTLGAIIGEDELPEGWLRDIFVHPPTGLVGDTTAYPRCSTIEFLELEAGVNGCPLETAVGATGAEIGPGRWFTAPVFNVAPPPGVLLRLGFRAFIENIVIDIKISSDPPYHPIASSRKIPQLAHIFSDKVQLWGNPSDSAHDELRGVCGTSVVEGLPVQEFDFEFQGTGEKCSVSPQPRPFLTLPTDCSRPLVSRYEAFSWNGDFDEGETELHDAEGKPESLTGCEKMPFHPSIDAQPTSRAASSPTGLDFSLAVEDEGLVSLDGQAQSDIRDVTVILPEGMTANPSVAEGLEVCSEEQLGHETLQAAPGEGCPEASKIGTIEVESPLVDKTVMGSLFQAKPFENLAGDALIAFYVVLKDPELGLLVKLPARVQPDARTGQLVASSEGLPQLPFSHFRLRFREGGRSPLVTPSLCGSYQAKAVMTPWSGMAPVTAASSFEIISGPNGSSCPTETPPFDPGFAAGSRNNAAGAYSPFAMRLTRRDGDQDLTRFDATLPPGVVAKLAGVAKCSDAQIALAKNKAGRVEKADPSCPASSKIGMIQSGAGVGSQLTYVPGSLYLAGPFGGAPLSAVAIVPAVAGPFDIGTVVVRQALEIDPRSGEVSVDGGHSDPIPHILAGIPLVVRDIQVDVDRREFTLNPTSCDPFATEAAIWGGGANLFATADDSPVARRARYQASNCSSLGFKPKLVVRLKGGTKRGRHPKLHSVYAPRQGDANLESLVLRLPRSAFLDQAHIRTICTRVQFAAKSCPPGAIYGHAQAVTPLLSEPLEGPIYLRSSNHDLPDFVAFLHGIVDIEAVARIDSKHGGIRATFADLPDAPIDHVVVDMQGARKGLIVNSANLCSARHRADVRLDSQSGKRLTISPTVRADCGGGRKSRTAHH